MIVIYLICALIVIYLSDLCDLMVIYLSDL